MVRMLVNHEVILRIKFASTNLYTWVERGTVRCLAQEKKHNVLAKASTWTIQSGIKHTIHEAWLPLPNFKLQVDIINK